MELVINLIINYNVENKYMKYKKQFATGALAISLLISGSNVFAATPQDLGIKNSQQVYNKQNKSLKNNKMSRSSTVGTISSINGNEFTVDVKNIKTKVMSAVDIKTDTTTKYSKNGISTNYSLLAVGQKVIVTGSLEKTTNIITAKTVKMV